MKYSKGCLFLATALLLFLYAGSLQAALMSYTDYSSFMTDLPGSANVLDFDSMSNGTIIANGDTVDGITFTYDFDGIEMMVTGYNELGTNDSAVFQDGDDFSLSFASSNAIGMYFISGDDMEDSDITLTAGGDFVDLSVSSGVDLGEGWYAYFLGIIDTDNSFTEAWITTIGEGAFLYTVDDIITTSADAAATPEPTSILLLGIGLVGMAGFRLRNKR